MISHLSARQSQSHIYGVRENVMPDYTIEIMGWGCWDVGIIYGINTTSFLYESINYCGTYSRIPPTLRTDC